jgi:polyisoprenoid-binding protein YceI
MTNRFGVCVVLGSTVAIAMSVAGGAIAVAQVPLAMASARITISGTSNIHAYTASTTAVRVTRAQLGGAVEATDLWANATRPGAVEAFEVAIPAAMLTSPRAGLDKNMHKALKVEQYPDITYRLVRLESVGAGVMKAIGILRIAGVEREVVLELKSRPTAAGLAVSGETQLLMTDYGIKPPTAMLGMLKTDPKVTITFETVLTVPLT